MSSDVSLVKKFTYQRQTGGYYYTGVNGMNVYNPTYDTRYDKQVLSRSNVNITGGNSYNVQFTIPRDATNSSYTPASSITNYSKIVSYGVLVKLVVSTRSGTSKEVNEFKTFENKALLMGSTPKYFYKNDSKFSMLIKSNTSAFMAGEKVVLKVLFMRKCSKMVTSLSVDTPHFKKYSRIGLFVNILPKNLSGQDDYQYMKNALDRGMGNKFTFTLPSDLDGESNRRIGMDCVLKGVFSNTTFHMSL